MDNPFVRNEKTPARRRREKILKILLLILLLVTVFFIGCLLGKYKISFLDVFKTFFGFGTPKDNLVMFDMRLPRLCLAILVGVAMGASGVIMQDLLHNELASPGTLGVSDGATLMITIYMAFLFTKKTNPVLMPFLALIGGILSALIIYALGTRRKKPISSTKLIMTGVAVGAAYSAFGTFITYALDETKLQSLQMWQAGELWAANESNPWIYISILFLWVLAFGFIAIYRGKVLNAISLGFDTATSLGIDTRKEFLLLSFVSVALSSGAVAFGGNFFFLGLIGPHIARRIVGSDARYVIPTSGVVASIMVMLANILVTDFDLFANIPTGIFVSIVSVPYFIYLLLKSR